MIEDFCSLVRSNSSGLISAIRARYIHAIPVISAKIVHMLFILGHFAETYVYQLRKQKHNYGNGYDDAPSIFLFLLTVSIRILRLTCRFRSKFDHIQLLNIIFGEYFLRKFHYARFIVFIIRKTTLF